MVAAMLAMLVANLPATAAGYATLLHSKIGPGIAPAQAPMTVHRWIDEGLMALFFLLVGLEVKRALVDGPLSGAARRLPILVGGAGMAVPAIVYLLIAGTTPGLARGWAIPAATDIAFAVGVLALLGPRVPVALTLFLTAVAIVDDIGAVAIIALVYTPSVDAAALAAAAGTVALMVAASRRGVTAAWPYAAGFALLWYCTLLSGVHATVAGVVAAACVPLAGRSGRPSPLDRMEHALIRPVRFGVVPLFAFANAGVSLHGIGASALADPLVIGIAAGLFLGKQAGVMGAVWVAGRLGIAGRPGGAGWEQVYGIALVAGIGFTMSLFVGGLAFPGQPDRMAAVRLGVLAGSVLSAVAGYVVLRFCATTPRCAASSLPSS